MPQDCSCLFVPVLSPAPGTCHDVLHHRNEVGRLAEGGRVVVLVLEGRHTGQCVGKVLTNYSKRDPRGHFGMVALRPSGL